MNKLLFCAEKGIPVTYLPSLNAGGAPEMVLLSAAMTDVAKWLRLPMFSTAGCSDAKVLDQQAAIEAAMSVTIAALSGANLIHDVGYMESSLTTSYEMIVLTDELVAMTDHIMEGIEVSDDTLMLDEVGPGGHFLNTEQSLKRFRDFWFPGLLHRARGIGPEAIRL